MSEYAFAICAECAIMSIMSFARWWSMSCWSAGKLAYRNGSTPIGANESRLYGVGIIMPGQAGCTGGGASMGDAAVFGRELSIVPSGLSSSTELLRRGWTVVPRCRASSDSAPDVIDSMSS